MLSLLRLFAGEAPSAGAFSGASGRPADDAALVTLPSLRPRGTGPEWGGVYAGSLYASDQIEIDLDLVPTLLGEGVQLLDVLGIEPVKLERTRVVEAQGLTHLGFRLAK